MNDKARWTCALVTATLVAGLSAPAAPYPIDGYDYTGIRRLEAARLTQAGERRGTRLPPGGKFGIADIDLRLADQPSFERPEADPEFTRQIVRLLGEQKDRYSVSVLDLSDPANPRYAEHRGQARDNPGSVGKIFVALALFQALADLYPDDICARRRVLMDTVVTADPFIRWDSHEVRLYDPLTNVMQFRPLEEGDQGSLYEILDWSLSASSNAAAALLMQQVMLLDAFGKAYPPTPEQARAWFDETPKKTLGEQSARLLQQPLIRHGFDVERIRQGSFFTREGKRRVPGTTSLSTTRDLLDLLVLMEQGKLVDAYSSRELKRMLYMTQRRIRYASAPALADSAVYFKSGSLYKCAEEEGFVCKKYHGNVRNLMNSAAIVETQADGRELFYVVTVMSNVLRRNSAVDHQTLATRIHRLIERAHPAMPVEAPADASSGRPAGQ